MTNEQNENVKKLMKCSILKIEPNTEFLKN